MGSPESQDRERTRPRRQHGGRSCPTEADGEAGGARIHLTEEDFTSRAEVLKGFKQANVAKGGVYVDRRQKRQGLRYWLQRNLKPKGKRSAMCNSDLHGEEGREWEFKHRSDSSTPRME